MKPGLPWSVKGVEPEAREAAKMAARRAGLTLGQWLNRTIMEQSLAQATAAQPPGMSAAPYTPTDKDEADKAAKAAADTESDAEALKTLNETVTALNAKIETLTEQIEARKKEDFPPKEPEPAETDAAEDPLKTAQRAAPAIDDVPITGTENPYISEFLSPDAYAAQADGMEDIEQFLADERSRGRAYAIAAMIAVLAVGIAGFGYYTLYLKPKPGSQFAVSAPPAPPAAEPEIEKVAELEPLAAPSENVTPTASETASEASATPSEEATADTEPLSLQPAQQPGEPQSAAITASNVTAPEAAPPLQDAATEPTRPEELAPAAGQPANLSPWNAYERGLAYSDGDGVAVDHIRAANWFEQAAEQNHTDAQYRLGLAYHQGKGRPVDLQRALVWMHQAAGAGHVDAQYRLGVIYATAEGANLDYQQAKDWFERAAAAGHRDAQYNLGVLYLKGEGVQADTVEAYKWFNIAAKQNDAEAIRQRDALHDSMTPQDLIHAKALAAVWQVRMAGRTAPSQETVARQPLAPQLSGATTEGAIPLQKPSRVP